MRERDLRGEEEGRKTSYSVTTCIYNKVCSNTNTCGYTDEKNSQHALTHTGRVERLKSSHNTPCCPATPQDYGCDAFSWNVNMHHLLPKVPITHVYINSLHHLFHLIPLSLSLSPSSLLLYLKEFLSNSFTLSDDQRTESDLVYCRL